MRSVLRGKCQLQVALEQCRVRRRRQRLDVAVEKSSRNRNLDRAAMDAARKWKFNPEMQNGVGVQSRVRVPVDFVPPT